MTRGEAVKHPTSLMFAYWGLGLPYLRKGELTQACLMLERAVASCQEFGLRFHVTLTAPLLGMAYVLCGRADDAIPLVEQAVEIATSIGATNVRALQNATLGEAHLRAGHLEDACTLALRALELARTYKERGNEAYALRLLGEIAMHRNPSQVDQGKSHYQQALALATELGMRPLQAHCQRGLGMLYHQTGQSAQARAELSTAIDLYREMQMTFWLPPAENVLLQMEN